jgi:hypothetical protein
MIAYASRTGTKRNLRALRLHGWRLLVTPERLSTEGFRYALDNGAWGAHQRGESWCEGPFVEAVARLGADADWVVAPDIVAGGRASLERSKVWLPRLLDVAPVVLVAVQDGMVPADIEPLLGERVGLFVGGSTEWKLATLRTWCGLARGRGAWAHVGRVNSVRRINRCLAAGATSFDGSSVSRYAVNITKLDAARRQRLLHFQDGSSPNRSTNSDLDSGGSSGT